VPQGRHLHLLLPAGVDALEALFPGLVADLCAAGATASDADRIRLCLSGHRLTPASTGHRGVFCSRPFLESHLRRRVCAEPAVTIHDGLRVTGLVLADHGSHVEGAEVTTPGGDVEVVGADLVVDCSGRRSTLRDWLADLGRQRPEVDELEVQVRYATRRYALPDGVLDGDHHVLVGPTRDGPRGAAMTHIEDGSWIVTLFAMAGERAPSNGEDFGAIAKRLPIPDVHEAIDAGRPLDDPAPYRFPAERRIRYERLTDLPEGLLAAGDTVCSFNPIYGQGMSVAAMEARLLQERLRAGTVPSARGWFRDIARVIDTPWELAVGSDLAVDAVRGRRSLRVRVMNRYLDRLQRAATTDPRLTERLVRVVGLTDPPSHLLSPVTVRRVLRGRPRRR
jgi:2-polyprenyl-6-methoxyphenol hydroxylase-like FAD-dependent oxidoreductase